MSILKTGEAARAKTAGVPPGRVDQTGPLVIDLTNTYGACWATRMDQKSVRWTTFLLGMR